MSISLIAAALSLFALEASAEEPWRLENFSMDVDVRGSASRDYTYSGVRITNTDTARPQISFSCSKRTGLVATLFLDPAAAENGAEQSRKRVNTKVVKRAVVTADQSQLMPFNWVRSRKILQSRQHKTAARLYNAVVKDETFTVAKVTFDPPPTDPVFKSFATQCAEIRSK